MSDFDETAWWGNCASTWHEERKQFVYAVRMGLRADWDGAHPPTFDVEGRSIVDIGGGPVSLLLKCVNRGRAVVADPSDYPAWIIARYEACGIEYWRMEGESPSLTGYTFDEAWIYNCLQHVDDPEKVIANAWNVASTIRIFEWIGVDPYPGHTNRLEKDDLDDWLGSPGFTTQLSESGCVGYAYYGVFGRSKSRAQT